MSIHFMCLVVATFFQIWIAPVHCSRKKHTEEQKLCILQNGHVYHHRPLCSRDHLLRLRMTEAELQRLKNLVLLTSKLNQFIATSVNLTF